MKYPDFSCKHHILIENDDGTRFPMDFPYFRATLIAPETWQILTAGDFSYLVAGEHEAILIDSGYGAGNIRQMCQLLTERPLRSIVNTHHHFDHTANNCYFDCAYMSKETVPLATIPFQSFEGIQFPRDYPVEVIDEGYVFDLGSRTLETMRLSSHVDGSLLFLDQKERILFAGDAIFAPGIPSPVIVMGSVEKFADQLKRIVSHRSCFDRIYTGGGYIPTESIDKYLANAQHIMDGYEGELPPEPPRRSPCAPDQVIVYDRMRPRPGDTTPRPTEGLEYQRIMRYAGCLLKYDCRYIKNPPQAAEKA